MTQAEPDGFQHSQIPCSGVSASPPGRWAVDAQGESGHPGSQRYCDQLPEWISGRYHYLPLDRAEAAKRTKSVFTLGPANTPAGVT